MARACYAYRGLFVSEDSIKIRIKAYPPDKRRRDLDNLLKSLLDSLQHAKLFPDDYQIDRLAIQRMPENLAKINVRLEIIG